MAYDDAVNRTRMIVFRRLFGRVKKMWLEPIQVDFEIFSEHEYEDLMIEVEEEDMNADQIVKITDENSGVHETADEDDGVEEVQMVVYTVNN